MSSIDFMTMPITDLLAYRSALEVAIISQCGGSVAGAIALPEVKGKKGKGGKEKKPSARAGKPTAYGDFSSKIQKDFAEEIKAFKEANPEMKGAHMTWVGSYKEKHPEIYETFKAEWAVAHPKTDAVSASTDGSADEASGDATGAAEAKPKKVLSPEHLAKMKAGREAKKAAKDAEKALAEAEGRAEAPIAVSAKAEKVERAKKEPKKAKKATEITVPLAALPPAAPAPADAEDGEKEAEALPFKLGGATYIRMGVSKPDGNHEWLSGDLWLSKKGGTERGAYAGELMEDGSINTDAEEPELS